MHSARKRITLLITCVILILGITVSAIGVNMGKKPAVQAGKFENLIADRIELTVENTEFQIKKASTSAETFTLTFYLSAKKTQADFYAELNSFSINNIAYDNIVFTALTPAAENKTISDLTLTATEGVPDEFRWEADVTMTFSGKGVYTANLNIIYTSGMTAATAQQKLFEIPILIEVK